MPLLPYATVFLHKLGTHSTRNISSVTQQTQHAKFARKKVLTTLQYMDPALMESHTGMKVLTHEEYEKLSADLEETRSKIRNMNSQVQQKYSEVLKVSLEVQNMKQEISELTKLIEEN